MNERLPQNYIPTHYDIYIHVIPDQHPFKSRVSITFAKNQDSDEVILDIHENITVTKVTQNDIELTYNTEYPKLKIFRSEKQDISQYPVVIEYMMTPNFSDNKGFYSYDDSFLTEFEANYAQYMFPCFDEPCVKSTFTVSIQIPTELTGLSNMPIDTVQNVENEKIITFLKTPPMVTYLLCICIGDFKAIEGCSKSGIPVKMYTKSGEENLLEEFLRISVFSIDWCESKLGVKYELPHLQLLSYEGFRGGMENYGLIALRDYIRDHGFMRNMLANMHEISHLWFGDLVSVKWWDSSWLNEGFAQYFQYLMLRDYDSKYSSSYIDLFIEREGLRAFRFDDKKVVPSESEIDLNQRVLQSVMYVKGAFILKMFSDMIGEDKFFEICHVWLDSFKNKCADTNDFINLVNKQLNDDYTDFFDVWLRKEGNPVLNVVEVKSESQPDKIIGIKIIQKSSSNSVYKFKLSCAYANNDNDEIKKIDVMIKDAETTINLDFKWIVVNDNVGSLCAVIYSKELLQKLVQVKDELSEFNKTLISYSPRFARDIFSIDDDIAEIYHQMYS